MVWAFSAENVSNVKNYFINFCNAVFAYILNNTVVLSSLGTLLSNIGTHLPPLGPISLAWGHKKPGLH